MRSSRYFPRRTSLVALCLSSALLAGCGGDGEGGSSASPSAPASGSASASPSASASKTPAPAKVKPSTNLDKVKVAGDYGKAPKVTVPAPWGINKTQTKVLKPSTGAVITASQLVDVNYYGVNARTGKKFDDSFSRGESAAFSLEGVVPGFKKGLVGQRQGSRVLVAMPGPDGYDASGGNPQAGINVGDTLLFVIDIVGPLAGPEGAKVAAKPGLPTVTEAKGVPAISVPKSTPPAKLQVQPLIKGNGKKVGPTDTITFNYRWVAWKDGRLLEQSYGAAPATAPLSQMLPGMQKGLANQAVGSRVLLVMPPSEAYPNGNAKPQIAKGESLVMVVDLLLTMPTQ